jgi:hypothetical protein
VSVAYIIDAARQRRRLKRERHNAAIDEWSRRKEAVLADPIGRLLWETMARHHLSLNSRSPVYGWQVERVYVMTVEDMLTAIAPHQRPSADDRKGPRDE